MATCYKTVTEYTFQGPITKRVAYECTPSASPKPPGGGGGKKKTGGGGKKKTGGSGGAQSLGSGTAPEQQRINDEQRRAIEAAARRQAEEARRAAERAARIRQRVLARAGQTEKQLKKMADARKESRLAKGAALDAAYKKLKVSQSPGEKRVAEQEIYNLTQDLKNIEQQELRDRGKKVRKTAYDRLGADNAMAIATGRLARHGFDDGRAGPQLFDPDNPQLSERYTRDGERAPVNPLLQHSVNRTGGKKPGDRGYARRAKENLAREATFQEANPEHFNPDALNADGDEFDKHARKVGKRAKKVGDNLNRTGKELDKMYRAYKNGKKINRKRYEKLWDKYASITKSKEYRDLMAEWEDVYGVFEMTAEGKVTQKKKGIANDMADLLQGAFTSHVEYQDQLVAANKLPAWLDGANAEALAPVFNEANNGQPRFTKDQETGKMRPMTPNEALFDLFASGDADKIMEEQIRGGQDAIDSFLAKIEDKRDDPILGPLYKQFDKWELEKGADIRKTITRELVETAIHASLKESVAAAMKTPEVQAALPSNAHPGFFDASRYVTVERSFYDEEGVAEVYGLGMQFETGWVDDDGNVWTSSNWYSAENPLADGPYRPALEHIDPVTLEQHQITQDQQFENVIRQIHEDTIREELGIEDPGPLDDLLRTKIIGDALVSIDSLTAFSMLMVRAGLKAELGLNIPWFDDDPEAGAEGAKRPTRRQREALVRDGKTGQWVEPPNLGLGPEGDALAFAASWVLGPFMTVHDETESGVRYTTFSGPFLPLKMVDMVRDAVFGDDYDVPFSSIDIEVAQGEEVNKELQEQLFEASEAFRVEDAMVRMRWLGQEGELFTYGNAAGIANVLLYIVGDPTNFIPGVTIARKSLGGLRSIAKYASDSSSAGLLHLSDLYNAWKSGYSPSPRMADDFDRLTEIGDFVKNQKLEDFDIIEALNIALDNVKAIDGEAGWDAITDILVKRFRLKGMDVDRKLLRAWVEQEWRLLAKARGWFAGSDPRDIALALQKARSISGGKAARIRRIEFDAAKRDASRVAKTKQQDKDYYDTLKDLKAEEAAAKKKADVEAARKAVADTIKPRSSAAVPPSARITSKPPETVRPAEAPKATPSTAGDEAAKTAVRKAEVRNVSARTRAADIKARQENQAGAKALKERLAAKKEKADERARLLKYRKRKESSALKLSRKVVKAQRRIEKAQKTLANPRTKNKAKYLGIIERASKEITESLDRARLQYNVDLKNIFERARRKPSAQKARSAESKANIAALKDEQRKMTKHGEKLDEDIKTLRARKKNIEIVRSDPNYKPGSAPRWTEANEALLQKLINDRKQLTPVLQNLKKSIAAARSSADAPTGRPVITMADVAPVNARVRKKKHSYEELYGERPKGEAGYEWDASKSVRQSESYGLGATGTDLLNQPLDLRTIFPPGSDFQNTAAYQQWLEMGKIGDDAQRQAAYTVLYNAARAEWARFSSLTDETLPGEFRRSLRGVSDTNSETRAVAEQELRDRIVRDSQIAEAQQTGESSARFSRSLPTVKRILTGSDEEADISRRLADDVTGYTVNGRSTDFYAPMRPYDPDDVMHTLDTGHFLSAPYVAIFYPRFRGNLTGDSVAKYLTAIDKKVNSTLPPVGNLPAVQHFRMRHQYGYDLFHQLLGDARAVGNDFDQLEDIHKVMFARAFDDATGSLLVKDDIAIAWLLMETRAGLPFAMPADVIEILAMQAMRQKGLLDHLGIAMFDPSYSSVRSVGRVEGNLSRSLSNLDSAGGPIKYGGDPDPKFVSKGGPSYTDQSWFRWMRRRKTKQPSMPKMTEIAHKFVKISLQKYGAEWIGVKNPMRQNLLAMGVRTTANWGIKGGKWVDDVAAKRGRALWKEYRDAMAKKAERLKNEGKLAEATDAENLSKMTFDKFTTDLDYYTRPRGGRDYVKFFGFELHEAYESLLSSGRMLPTTPQEATTWLFVHRQFYGTGDVSYKYADFYLKAMKSFGMEEDAIKFLRVLDGDTLDAFVSQVDSVRSGAGAGRRVDELLDTPKGKYYQRLHGNQSGKRLKQRITTETRPLRQRTDTTDPGPQKMVEERRLTAAEGREQLDAEEAKNILDQARAAMDGNEEPYPSVKVGFEGGVDDLQVAALQIGDTFHAWADESGWYVLKGKDRPEIPQGIRKDAQDITSQVRNALRTADQTQLTSDELAGLFEVLDYIRARPELFGKGAVGDIVKAVEDVPVAPARVVAEGIGEVRIPGTGRKGVPGRSQLSMAPNQGSTRRRTVATADDTDAQAGLQKQPVELDDVPSGPTITPRSATAIVPERTRATLPDEGLSDADLVAAVDGDFDSLASSASYPGDIASDETVEAVVAGAIRGHTGVTETQWLYSRRKKLYIKLRNTASGPEHHAILKEIEMVNRALRHIRSLKDEGLYDTPGDVLKKADKAVKGAGDELKGYQPPRSISYYAENPKQLDVETYRSIRKALKNYVVRRRTRPGARMTGIAHMADNFRPEHWQLINDRVTEAIKQVQAKRTESVSPTLVDPRTAKDDVLGTRRDPFGSPQEDAKFHELRKVQDELGIPRREQLTVDDYDRIRTLLEPHMGRRRRGLSLLEKTADDVIKNGSDFKEMFLKFREEWADTNVLETLRRVMIETPSLTPAEAMEVVKYMWFDDGTLRHKAFEIFEADEAVLKKMFNHLSGVDYDDVDAVRNALSAHGTLPPMNRASVFKTFMQERGTWSPRVTPLAVERGAWSMAEKKKWWIDNYETAPRYVTDERLQPGGSAFKSGGNYHEVMVDTGNYDEAARVQRSLAGEALSPEDLSHGRPGDEVKGIKEIKKQKDWDTERQYFIEYYGKAVSHDGKTLYDAPWLMTPEELGAWASRNPEHVREVLGDAADIPAIQRAVSEVTQKHFDRLVEQAGAVGQHGPPGMSTAEIHRMSYDITRELSISKPWLHQIKGIFNLLKSPSSYLDGWAYFWTTLVTAFPAFTVLNVSDPMARGLAFTLSDPVARKGLRASDNARKRADNFFSLDGIGIPTEQTAFFYGKDSRTVMQRLRSDTTYGKMDRIGGVWQLLTRSLPRTVLPWAENTAKGALGRRMFMGYWDNPEIVSKLRAKGLSDDAIDRAIGILVRDRLNKLFPTLGTAGTLEKIINQLFPFVSYYAKNQIIWVGWLLDHPWAIRLLQHSQEALSEHNQKEWRENHPNGEAMPEHLHNQFRIPMKGFLGIHEDFWFDIGVLTDAARGGELIAGGADVGNLGDLINRIFRPLPAQKAFLDHIAWKTTSYGGRWKYVPMYDEDGRLMLDENGEIMYEQTWVGPKTPWGADSYDMMADLFWPVGTVKKIVKAAGSGNDATSNLIQMLGDLTTFSAFSQPSRYYMLNQQYFAMAERDEEAAREWLNDTDEGQWLIQKWREAEDPSTYAKVDPFVTNYGPPGSEFEIPTVKEIRSRWLKNQSGMYKTKLFDAWDQLDVMHDEWDAIVDVMEFTDAETRKAMWAARNAAFQEFYMMNPELWYYKGMGMTNAQVDEFMSGYQTDLEMGEFFDLFDYSKRPRNKKKLALWEKQREEWLKAHPRVVEELENVDNSFEASEKLINEIWQNAFEGLDTAKTLRKIAYESDDLKKLRAVGRASEFYQAAFDAEVFGFDPEDEDMPWKRKGDMLTRKLRAAGGDEKAKAKAYYAERMEGAFRQATDKNGELDYYKWLKIIDRNADLKEMYFENNPKERARFDLKLGYMGFWHRFRGAADKGNWDRAWAIFNNMPDDVRKYMERKNPGKWQQLRNSYLYSNYMGKWVGMFDTHGAAAAMKYFDSLPGWVKERYYRNNPGKRMTSGAGSAYVSALDTVFGMIDRGDWDKAESYWNSLPSWMRSRYYQNNPSSKLFRGKGGSSGGSGGGLPDAKYKQYIKAMKKWADLHKDGKGKEADKYYKSLPKWMRDFYEARHKDRGEFYEDSKWSGMFQEYLSASKAEKKDMLRKNPGFARWVNSLDAGAAWRSAVMAAYSELDDPWLKRVYREKYPEIFSPEGRGERYKKDIFDTLEEHPEFAKPWLKWYKHINETLLEAMKYQATRPKDILPDHETYRRTSHHGLSADEVRERARHYSRQAWDLNKRVPNLETAIR